MVVENGQKFCEEIILQVTKGEVQEWLNWHAWKACVLQNGTGGSNPPLSADNLENLKEKYQNNC